MKTTILQGKAHRNAIQGSHLGRILGLFKEYNRFNQSFPFWRINITFIIVNSPGKDHYGAQIGLIFPEKRVSDPAP